MGCELVQQLLIWMPLGSFSLRVLPCMHCVYLALLTRKGLCGSVFFMRHASVFIHSFIHWSWRAAGKSLSRDNGSRRHSARERAPCGSHSVCVLFERACCCLLVCMLADKMLRRLEVSMLFWLVQCCWHRNFHNFPQNVHASSNRPFHILLEL